MGNGIHVVVRGNGAVGAAIIIVYFDVHTSGLVAAAYCYGHIIYDSVLYKLLIRNFNRLY